MSGFRVGRVFGFEIRIDYSWFIILALIVWSFSVGVFPASVPGLPQAAYIAMGVGGAILFFASLLAHELSHSVVAKRKGIVVEGITLFIFGGVARTRSEATSPGDEFAIAGVGPLASVIIGAVLWGAAILLAGTLHPAFIAVLHYLGILNLALAAFNLLPGFPLDGGRVFRSIVWKITGDLDRATRVATTAGRWLGLLLMGLGGLSVVQGDIGGLWLAFIGWYLRNAANMSWRQHAFRSTLGNVRAADAMSPTPESVPADMTLDHLMQDVLMRSRHIAFPAMAGGSPVGVVTLQQLRGVPRETWANVKVADVMLPLDHSLVVSPVASMVEVMERMQSSPDRRILVVDGGELVGIISAFDIAHWLERASQLQAAG
jgi:Zn-dependent protease/predicted transcriptional regulator